VKNRLKVQQTHALQIARLIICRLITLLVELALLQVFSIF